MLNVIQEEKINLFSEKSEWEHLPKLKDMISDSSDDNNWLW